MVVTIRKDGKNKSGRRILACWTDEHGYTHRRVVKSIHDQLGGFFRIVFYAGDELNFVEIEFESAS